MVISELFGPIALLFKERITRGGTSCFIFCSSCFVAFASQDGSFFYRANTADVQPVFAGEQAQLVAAVVAMVSVVRVLHRQLWREEYTSPPMSYPLHRYYITCPLTISIFFSAK